MAWGWWDTKWDTRALYRLGGHSKCLIQGRDFGGFDAIGAQERT